MMEGAVLTSLHVAPNYSFWSLATYGIVFAGVLVLGMISGFILAQRTDTRG
jgi:hypothetical protein